MSILNPKLGSIRLMNASDLSMVLEWRNHEDVRKYMFTQHEISMEEHAKWFDRASQDKSKCNLIFEYMSELVGFVSFNFRDSSLSADWGFYMAPSSKKGTGTLLGASALNYAFTDLGLDRVYGQAISYNERSIEFHLKLGFTNEGRALEQYDDGVKLYDIICFSLNAEEWGGNI